MLFPGIFGFWDHDKVLYGLKIRFQLQRNDNENRLLFGVGSAFGDENKFVIDEMSCNRYIKWPPRARAGTLACGSSWITNEMFTEAKSTFSCLLQNWLSGT